MVCNISFAANGFLRFAVRGKRNALTQSLAEATQEILFVEVFLNKMSTDQKKMSIISENKNPDKTTSTIMHPLDVRL